MLNHSAFAAFLAAHPAYQKTQALDDLRRREFARLDDQGQVYLDYTGGGLYAGRLVQAHADLLLQTVLGNPHSQNPTSLAATALVERARADVLRYFRADADEYTVIFTANASGALKLLAESYPFGPDKRFLLVADNHNSVHGIREFARARGAAITYIPLDPDSLRAPDITPYLDPSRSGAAGLFAFPAQSNFSGVQHPLTWVNLARELGYDVLLDAAAFVPSNRLDLGQVQPDFAAISFYKMFGYPTGIGALLARRQALAKLQRPWFAGGTVRLVSTKADLHIMAPDHEAFEEGTVNYLGLPAISLGLSLLDEIGIEAIHERVMTLTTYLLGEMQALRHSNAAPIIHIYGPGDAEGRGGTIPFNVLDPAGHVFPFQLIEAEATAAGISIRAGCFCNPGAGEYSLTHGAAEVRRCAELATQNGHFDLDRYQECLGDKPKGALRASLGMVSNFADVHSLLQFLAGYGDRVAGGEYHLRGC
ncbi:MAG: aminotransferase class V-fold PLP-dependent enzyme [Caldilineales bacterium]|nr:aminotransferase class V-fold PLP-dependent enzyme [Caldilineales bacterium]